MWKKDAGGKADVGPQDAPNIELLRFSRRVNFASLPVTHEIGAVNQSELRNMLEISNERTLDPTKHPPDGATTHSNLDPCNFRFGKIPCISERSEDFIELVDATDHGGKERLC